MKRQPTSGTRPGDLEGDLEFLMRAALKFDSDAAHARDDQLEFFSTPEREQLERNMNSLKARAERIPREIEQETSLIRKRFENPTARLFPLAVTLLVPQKLV